MSTTNITSALRRLDLGQSQQSIYLSLLTDGQATARVLSARTGMTRPSVYDQLKSLIALNLVVELDIEGKAEFAAADIKYLDALLEDKIDRLQQSRDFLTEALPTLSASFHTVTPKLRFFAGEEGVKQLLKDIMWHDKTTLQIIWPEKKMNQVFDRLFLEWFDDRRKVRQLAIQSLWVSSVKKVADKLFSNGIKDTQRRLDLEKTITMATIIYDTKVAFISSSAEAFGFIVESTEFTQSEREKFVSLWSNAK
jgi:sugar-specific transcriptional regulator TrmB